MTTILAVIAMLSACVSPSTPSPPSGEAGEGKPVIITTEDGIQVEGDLYNPGAEKGVILLHMLGRDRKTYSPIISSLAAKYSVLAIDSRGHGKSQGNVKSFSPAEFKAMVKDVAAARKLIGKKEVAIIGASIGANTALKYAVTDPSVKTVILLSPGLDYRGVAISRDAESLDRPALLVAAKGDSYSYESAQQLAKLAPSASVEVYEGDKHDTDLFGTGAGLEDAIMNWLAKTIG